MEKMIKDTYGCDGRSKNCIGEISYDEVMWYTSSIGFCQKCYEELHKRTPQSILDGAYDVCEGTGKEANEMAEFIISLTENNNTNNENDDKHCDDGFIKIATTTEQYLGVASECKEAIIESSNGKIKIDLSKVGAFEVIAEIDDFRSAYEQFVEHESSFDEGYRVEYTFDEFMEEIKKGYGMADTLEIQRLMITDVGILYDFDYMG